MSLKAITIRVTGRVQGVFYRANSREKAQMLNLKGWVKNEPSGDVSIYAEGEEEELFKFIDWCKQGPDLARVDEMNISWVEYSGKFASFEVKQ